MNTKQIKAQLNKHKGKTFTTIILVFAAFGWLQPFDNEPDLEPTPAVEIAEARPTSPAVPTNTARPPRGSATPTSVPSNTPTQTQPGASPSPTQPGATVTPGFTPPPIGCPPHENKWHAPADEPCKHHHHGDDITKLASVFSDGGFDLAAWLDTFGELYQPAWLSSVTEDTLGFIWLYFHVDGCALFNNGGELDILSFGCVTDFAIRIHDAGTNIHMVSRFHSVSYIIRGCDQVNGQPGDQCGILAGGGLTDYGILETPYKTAHCPLANDPPGFHSLDQPPYRAAQTQDRGDLVQFWSGLHPNAVNAVYYPHDPNALVGLAWSTTDAFQVWDPATGCGLETLEAAKAAAEDMPRTSYNHSNFSVFTVMVYGIPASPFQGYTDQWGHIMPPGECIEPGPTCIPLTITGNFPSKALYNRPVDNTVPGPNEYDSPYLLPPWQDTAP